MGGQQSSTVTAQQQNIQPQHDCANIPKGKERTWKPSSKCPGMDKENRKMSPDEREMVFGTLQNHFIFGKLDTENIEKIVSLMARCRVRAGCYILRKGQEPEALHIVSEGKLQIEFINQKIQKNTLLERGSIFGELAIVYHCSRSASIRAVTDAVLWTISTHDIIEVMREALQIQGGNYYKNMIIQLIEIFVRKSQREDIAKYLVESSYKSDEVIYQKDRPAEIVYFVAKGVLEESDKERKLQVGAIFGDEPLYNHSTRQSSIICKSDTIVIGCNFEAIRSLLGSRIYRFVTKCHLKSTIKSVPQFSSVEQSQIFQMIAATQVTPVKDYDCPDSRYQKSVYLWINWSLNSSITYRVFGSKQELAASLQNQSLEGYICQIPFYQCLKKNGRVVSINNLDEQQVTLQQLQLIKKIGEGEFSNVFLARTSQNIGLKGNLLAVKCINKVLVRQRQLQMLINNQKTIMSSIHSSSIVKYLGCLQDTQAIYLMMEYLEGYQLFHVMRQIGLFDRQSAMFVFGFLWHSIEHLHSKDIIYRDFKPQNIMVLDDGYCKLVDMGTAKILKQQNKFRTSTILGTPHYMAPQAFSQSGYSFQTDVWSIGVILYELVCGRLPFGQDCMDPMEIARQIMGNRVIFPSSYKDQQGKELITRLLQRYPHNRPHRHNYGAVRQHPYLKGLNWNELLVKSLDSPLKNHQPRTKSYLQGILNKFLEKFVSLNEPKTREPLSSINFLN